MPQTAGACVQHNVCSLFPIAKRCFSWKNRAKFNAQTLLPWVTLAVFIKIFRNLLVIHENCKVWIVQLIFFCLAAGKYTSCKFEKKSLIDFNTGNIFGAIYDTTTSTQCTCHNDERIVLGISGSRSRTESITPLCQMFRVLHAPLGGTLYPSSTTSAIISNRQLSLIIIMYVWSFHYIVTVAATTCTIFNAIQ